MAFSHLSHSLENELKARDSESPLLQIGNEGLTKRVIRKGVTWQTPLSGDEVEGDGQHDTPNNFICFSYLFPFFFVFLILAYYLFCLSHKRNRVMEIFLLFHLFMFSSKANFGFCFQFISEDKLRTEHLLNPVMIKGYHFVSN